MPASWWDKLRSVFSPPLPSQTDKMAAETQQDKPYAEFLLGLSRRPFVPYDHVFEAVVLDDRLLPGAAVLSRLGHEAFGSINRRTGIACLSELLRGEKVYLLVPDLDRNHVARVRRPGVFLLRHSKIVEGLFEQSGLSCSG